MKSQLNRAFSETGDHLVTKIDPICFDKQIYALYRAVWERWGDDAWYVVWRSGEVLLSEIEAELDLELDADPFTGKSQDATACGRGGMASGSLGAAAPRGFFLGRSPGLWPGFFTAMQRLADYLQQVGYVREIAVHPLSEDEWEYEMVDPVILPGAKRLLDEGAVPAHISTTLMFALLRRFGLQAEMVGDPDLRPDGRAIERWRLVPLTEA